jgi:hypothetical protein
LPTPFKPLSDGLLISRRQPEMINITFRKAASISISPPSVIVVPFVEAVFRTFVQQSRDFQRNALNFNRPTQPNEDA